MAQAQNESFSREMRKATRDIHKISDALVNAKLAFALSDDAVWADGLQIFYEIFKFLENNVSIEYLPLEYHRTEAFEKDLSYYIGPEWKNLYEPRLAVKKYINHLEYIQEKDPILLVAYVYHLYMGLLSGGQILQKKRTIARRINPFNKDDEQVLPGCNVTYFGGTPVAKLKEKMRKLLDEKAKDFDLDTRQNLIEESRRVFELNNKIVRTVKGVNRVSLKKIGIFVFCLFLFLNFSHKILLFVNWKYDNFLGLNIDELIDE